MGGRSGGCSALLIVVGKLVLTIVAFLLPSSLPIFHNYGHWQWTMEAAVKDDGCGGGGGQQLWWWWMTAAVDDNGG
jgi:hypothetical protein